MIRAEYIDHMGDDLRVVNAARVSFDKESDWVEACPCGQPGDINCTQECRFELSKGDRGLIRFLARGCSSQDWDGAVNELVCAMRADEVEEVLRWAKNMPTHWAVWQCVPLTPLLKLQSAWRRRGASAATRLRSDVPIITMMLKAVSPTPSS